MHPDLPAGQAHCLEGLVCHRHLPRKRRQGALLLQPQLLLLLTAASTLAPDELQRCCALQQQFGFLSGVSPSDPCRVPMTPPLGRQALPTTPPRALPELRTTLLLGRLALRPTSPRVLPRALQASDLPCCKHTPWQAVWSVMVGTPKPRAGHFCPACQHCLCC